MYEKESIDTRTFPQVWNSLTRTEQAELRDVLTRNGRCSRVSVYRWTKGASPISPALRREVASVIRKTFGLPVSHMTLFVL